MAGDKTQRDYRTIREWAVFSQVAFAVSFALIFFDKPLIVLGTKKIL